MPDSLGVTLTGRFEPAHVKRYAHVPFEVPSGVRALHVSYEYSDRIESDPLLSGGNTLDIGLFDPRGIAPSSPGFRGWSGSNRRQFSLTERWATPPYLSGPICPGTWHVLLGPYKVGPRGCDYEVRVIFDSEPGEPRTRPASVVAHRPPLTPSAEPGWIRGDLHCHTLHSDGDSWPADMMRRAIERGLDFLGVTDHNQVGHHVDYARLQGPALPIVLPGVEVTTYGGHWNAWGTDRWWEFREPDAAAVEQTMRAATSSGALVSVNHPKPFGPPWEYGTILGYTAVEVWNGDWNRLNDVALRWWDEQLRAGRRLVALGGSDTHYLSTHGSEQRHERDLGTPTTWAEVGDDRSPGGVLAALRSGRVFVSRAPSGPQVYFRRDEDGGWARVRVVDGRGTTAQVIADGLVVQAMAVNREDWSDNVSLDGRWSSIRVQLVDAFAQVQALTNPLQ